MSYIRFLNIKEKLELQITDRSDSCNAIKLYKDNNLIKYCKFKLENLTVPILSESINDAKELGVNRIICYPNSIFDMTDGFKVKMYPGDYYSLDFDLGKVEDVAVSIHH